MQLFHWHLRQSFCDLHVFIIIFFSNTYSSYGIPIVDLYCFVQQLQLFLLRAKHFQTVWLQYIFSQNQSIVVEHRMRYFRWDAV